MHTIERCRAWLYGRRLVSRFRSAPLSPLAVGGRSGAFGGVFDKCKLVVDWTAAAAFDDVRDPGCAVFAEKMLGSFGYWEETDDTFFRRDDPVLPVFEMDSKRLRKAAHHVVNQGQPLLRR